MNARQRFLAHMRYQPRDRAPLCDFGFWAETIEAWYEQGLPRTVTRANADDYFGMDGFEKYVLSEEGSAFVSRNSVKNVGGLKVGLSPTFEEIVLEDRGETELVQQIDGVRVWRSKHMSSIPSHAGHLLTDRYSWEKYYKPKLDPSTPGRLPEDWEESVAFWTMQRDYPLMLPAGSLYGWLRNWMGVEQLSLLVFRDSALFAEMVETVANCIYSVLERVLVTGAKFEAAAYWEDMCYNNGPLLGPKHFRQFLVPHYERLNALFRKYGIDIIWLDCDGQIDALLPLWLESGVNGMFPIEVGTWGGDPVRFRQKFGRKLLMLGGFNKHILAGDGANTPAEVRTNIEREIERLAPLVEEGGYIPFCDHRVPPDVTLENYLHYLRTARRVWCKNKNLKPLMADV